MKNTINHIENEINEIYEMIKLIPSNNSEIIELSKRQISRFIQNQIYETENEFNLIQNKLENIQYEIKLSESLIQGMDKENNEYKERIQSAQKKLDFLYQQNNLLSKHLDESRGMISVHNLKVNLKAHKERTKDELKQVEKEYRAKLTEVNSEYNIIVRELEERKFIIESLNQKIRDMTLKAISIKEENQSKIDQLKHLNDEETTDIEYRFRKQCEQALQNQRKSILQELQGI